MPSGAFKNKIRIRANGILIKEDALLMVQLHSPVSDELVWMPPGGGVGFGESMEACLQREFIEETGLEVSVDRLAFVNELVKPPFHALECYFRVTLQGGTLALGRDPELPDDEQLLQDVQWIPCADLPGMNTAPRKLAVWLDESAGSRPGFYS